MNKYLINLNIFVGALFLSAGLAALLTILSPLGSVAIVFLELDPNYELEPNHLWIALGASVFAMTIGITGIVQGAIDRVSNS